MERIGNIIGAAALTLSGAALLSGVAYFGYAAVMVLFFGASPFEYLK